MGRMKNWLPWKTSVLLMMTEEQKRRRIAENWASVQRTVQEAAIASGRCLESVRVIGVTKYVDESMTRALAATGCVDLGESRPQLLWRKSEAMTDIDSVKWHMIGHLQRNKVRRSLRCRPMIHSVDSSRLLNAVAEEAVQQETTVKVLLEVNISGDEAKTGFLSHELEPVLEAKPKAGVEVCGLMAMAGLGTDSTDARSQFEKVRELRDQLQAATSMALPELSMGMSGDYQQAILAGATMVRIGSVLFDGLIERR